MVHVVLLFTYDRDAGSSPESGDVESCWHFSNALKTCEYLKEKLLFVFTSDFYVQSVLVNEILNKAWL